MTTCNFDKIFRDPPDIQPLNKDVEGSRLNVDERNNSVFRFFPRSIQCFSKVIGVVRKEGFLNAVLDLSGSDFDDNVARGTSLCGETDSRLATTYELCEAMYL